jgi:hypothetical protein
MGEYVRRVQMFWTHEADGLDLLDTLMDGRTADGFLDRKICLCSMTLGAYVVTYE